MSSEAPEREWWDDPNLPWTSKPTRADLGCWIAFVVIGLYGLVMLPLRPIVLGLNLYLLAALTGSSTALAGIGANLRVAGDQWWWLGLLLAALSRIKFDWVFWWAGSLWGDGMLRVLSARRRRLASIVAWVIGFADRHPVLALLITALPIPMPTAVIFVVLGMGRLRWWAFVLIDLACTVVVCAGWMALGWWIGEPAKALVETIGDWSWALSIAIIVAMIGYYVWNSRRGGPGAPRGRAGSD